MKKVIALLLVLSQMAFLCACGSGGEESDADSEGKVVIDILWQEEDTYRFWEWPIEQFNATHPDVEINLETNAEAYSTIRNLLNIGEAPDIFYSWISDDVLANLPASVQTIWNTIEADGVTVISAPYKVKYKEVLVELNNSINALVQGEVDVDGFCQRMDTVAQGVN